MVGGVSVGILRERHTDHIVLGGDGAKIFLRDEQTVSEVNLWISLTVADTANGWKESRR